MSTFPEAYTLYVRGGVGDSVGFFPENK